MKTKTFFDLDQAEQYLRSSVIRYDGYPHYINSVNRPRGSDEFSLTLVKMTNERDVKSIPLSDPLLDMNPVPLGFFNYNQGGYQLAQKAMRLPSRGWKVGLTHRTLRMIPLPGDFTLEPDTLLYSQLMADTIIGKYPNFNTCLKDLAVNHPQGSIAFDRKFAIKGGSIYHLFHGKPIGTYTPSGTTKTNPEYEFLEESLQRALGT